MNTLSSLLYFIGTRINLDFYYPVGTYYETSKSQEEFDPNVAWGGTWVLDSQGRVTVSMDSSEAEFDTLGETGGAKTTTTGGHVLTTSQMPAHTHGSKSLSGTLRWGAARFGGTNTSSGIITKINSSPDAYFSTTGTQVTANMTGFTVDATHEHSSVGGGQAHSHEDTSTVQPYVVVNRWHRTA